MSCVTHCVHVLVAATDGNNIPEWKRAMLARKQQAAMVSRSTLGPKMHVTFLQAKVQDEESQKQADEAKWEGVPAWKRKLLEGKDQKKAKEMEPELQKQRKEAEKQAKLDAMPEWKRNLLLKKQQE